IKPYAGTSDVTTAPAPMNAYSPSVTPQMIVALAPIELPRFTSVRRYSFLRGTWLRGFITLVNTQEGPQKTSSSSSTPSQMEQVFWMLTLLPSVVPGLASTF